MHEALFGTRQQRGNSKKSSNDSDNRKKEEQNRDAMDERFERLVGNCLDALSMWINQGKHHGETRLPDTTTTVVWWKTLQSPKPSLRRKTYQLLSAVAMNQQAHHHLPLLLLPTNLDAILPQVVASEKEAVNIPILLETILTVLVHCGGKNNDNDDNNNNNGPTLQSSSLSSSSLLVKPLCRVLKKACCGARVELWGPMLLPLVAQFDDNGSSSSSSIQLLQAAHDGLSVLLGDAEQWPLLTALAESSSFLLLRGAKKQPQPQLSSFAAASDK